MMIYRRLLSAAVVCATLFAASGTAKSEILARATFPVSFDVFNECTGEWVMLEVDVRLVLTIVETSDGTIRMRQNGHANGWGIGLDSGAMYRFNDNFHFNRMKTIDTDFLRSGATHTRLIGLGKTPNQRLIYTLSYEVDEEGIITQVEISDVICQGD